MDYEALDGAILAVLPENSEVLSVAQHGSTNWSTGLRVDVQDGDDERSYFVKIIEREELVGMAEAEYEGQKAIASVIPDNAVVPVAWGYFSDTKAKAWFMAEFSNLRARAPPLEQFLPIVKQMHQKSVSPTGKFGFHVTPFYGPPPMVVDWTDNWEKFWVREFRSGLKYVESMRGHDAELLEIADQFIEKVAARLLRPLQTGGRNIKPSLCHGDLWDGNIQFNVDTQQPVIFDPCSFYGHHEMDFQCMKSPRYIIGQNFIDLYKVKVGASEPSEDFEDRVALYAIRNDLMTAGMWPQWASLIDKAKDAMKLLLEKYPDGLASFKGSLEPTIAKVDEDSTYDSASDDSGIDISALAQQRVSRYNKAHRTVAKPEPKPADSAASNISDAPPERASSEKYSSTDLPEHELSNSPAIEDLGLEATPAVDLEPPRSDEDSTGPSSGRLASAPASPARGSEAPLAASTNGSVLNNAFWYLVGRLNIWA
ncbi:Fructosamine/Ketosamine-3-kinase [Akanthomyces lecanii RCEF 1005]|uniref:protein-ribulosamine 3-kinase n=1 Tax=Akanthomyces lecanii RCEF 1005 TaxID=1081108 RepID=A0A168KIN9_CORDF|nr:Fructosamine/Ketosamine-3-kinase [Akanthomyces lecanii RCEF 1005]